MLEFKEGISTQTRSSGPWSEPVIFTVDHVQHQEPLIDKLSLGVRKSIPTRTARAELARTIHEALWRIAIDEAWVQISRPQDAVHKAVRFVRYIEQ